MKRLSNFFLAQCHSMRKRRLGSVKREGILVPVGLIKVPENREL